MVVFLILNYQCFFVLVIKTKEFFQNLPRKLVEHDFYSTLALILLTPAPADSSFKILNFLSSEVLFT